MNRRICAIALLASLCAPCTTIAVVFLKNGGDWPQSWPAELDSLRSQAKTLNVATGIQEHIYIITFENREQFERFWPILRKVRTPGSPLTLSTVGKTDSGWGDFVSNDKPSVRIKGPSGGYLGGKPTLGERLFVTGLEDETVLFARNPWPKEIEGPNGELPQYVIADKTNREERSWRAVDDITKETPAFFYRARTDIELVVDGEVISLNRIELPGDAVLIDERFADHADD